MNSEQDLINRLMISKKIMEKSDQIGRGQVQNTISTPIVEEFQPINGNYNIPQEFLQESEPQKKYNTEIPTEDRIMKSKLPDEIKQLMIQHPIQQSTMGVNSGVGLSEDLVERASRLMNTEQQPKRKNVVNETKQTQTDNSDIRSIIRETVEDVLRENGLIAESETKSNEVFKFRVGQHLFEGRVTNIKKIPKK
jgi:2-succinyl-5-enolpyruvyl-6-hydroxy-3-cyclohexene-1-carboxylate synthase